MTAALPEPVPLDMGPGDPGAVDELVRDVAGAAFRLALVGDGLFGPAASARGWLGDDAAAAEAQVVRVAGIARESAAAVLIATGRLSAHGELLRETRRRVDDLRAEQDEDFRAARQRLWQMADPQQVADVSGASRWAGVVAEIEAAEAARRRRHAVLLEELAADAAATGRVLADATRPVGGTGRAGDGSRVLAYLAAELPGWGDPELTRRGRALAEALVGAAPQDQAALAAEAASLAGNGVFATALVHGLGVRGVAELLIRLGQDPQGPGNPMAALLASALGAVDPAEGRHDRVAAVLGATYVRADERHPVDDTAAGMAAVLLAGTALPGGGLRPATVGEWARQLLLRERALALPAGVLPAGTAWDRAAADPAALAVGIVARSGDAAVAAALLGEERVWEALLSRRWDDEGAVLRELVVEAGRDGGPAGDRAVQRGLEVIGAGLVEGHPSDRTVDRETVAAVAPAIGEAVAAHLPVAVDALVALATDEGGAWTTDQLRGLGYVTVDRQAAAAVDSALAEWVVDQHRGLEGGGPGNPLPALAVPSAYLAVQGYGHDLTHALDGFELQEEAENKQRLWNWTAGLVLELVSLVPAKPVGVVADVVDGVVPKLLGMDGTFEQPEYRGPQLGAEDAVAQALATLPADRAAQVYAVARQAEAFYRRSTRTLGSPAPPESPRNDWGDVLLDIATDGLGGHVTDDLVDRAGRDGSHGGLLPGRR